MTKLEKLVNYLKKESENLRDLSKVFAQSKDYNMAQKYLVEARTEEYILMLLDDEEFLDKQLAVYEAINHENK